MLAKAAELYRKSGGKGKFASIEGRSGSAQVGGRVDLFKDLITKVPRQFITDNQLKMSEINRLKVQVAFAWAVAGKPDAATINKLTDDYLLIRLVDGRDSCLTLSLNPGRIGDFIAMIEMLKIQSEKVAQAA